MGLAMPGQLLGRNDRHVRRARLCVGPQAPRHRLAFNIEEALRLCWLPGENEGRTYYFCHLYVGDLPEDGDRRAWLDAFQSALFELARRAVHGLDGAARTADAVFFANEQEACETLLALILQRRSTDAWFWPAVSDSPPGSSPGNLIVALVEKLRRSPASWVTVAAAVFAAIEPDSPSALLSLLPEAVVRQWLRDLGDEERVLRQVTTISFSASTRTAIERAVAALGPEDPRVLWLASLAVVSACPSELEHGAIVSLARRSLGTIELSGPLPPFSRGMAPASPRRPPAKSEPATISKVDGGPNENERPDPGTLRDPRVSSRAHALDRPSTVTERPEVAPLTLESSFSGSTDLCITPPGSPREREGTSSWVVATPGSIVEAAATGSEPAQGNAASRRDRSLRETTRGAGLYFLLNALGRLKTADDPFSLRFLAHFFQRAASHAGIESDDPILLWTHLTLDEADADETDERLLRVWLLKVRRWCWRNGKITVREIVRRPGRVTLTRTDLDVSLALDQVDIRIRRIGLDLDPGWVPWFGRVVRFHYLYRGELDA